MSYLILKHKKKDVFGNVIKIVNDYEIWESDLPTFFTDDTTMEKLLLEYQGHSAYKDLKKFNLIGVKIVPIT